MRSRSIVGGIFASVAVGVLLSGCMRGGDARPDADSAAGAVMAPMMAPEKVIAWKLVTPASWSERTRSVALSDSDRARQYPGARAVERFDYLPADPKLGVNTLLRISVYDSTTWGRVSSMDGPPVGEVITRERDYVYIASFPKGNPYPPSNPESKAFEARVVTLAEVKESFRVVTP